mmetsp:Transcript_44410/g.105894  ORF Transcript_44410/g.105894 Transcript_44410/m.105894 type:complete len:338 (-) Transcript_44410:169-1182(-)|eukprot:CAMPEP_0180146846 /NCGR_PEP_ID=MMETSP0986-20121125/18830_1 /TAXON_ID=697907 /ORGANISM="non described non described, Strain CCMP2293" /LENGTH=337 /DNA_ID=CAMNT_0022092135 /DNA_START=266 /DNA_END=1279 /DNA_ORIENTATION=+
MNIAASDHEVKPSPADSVQALKFSPNNNMFLTASWDNTVQVYSFQKSGQQIMSQGIKSMTTNPHTQAVLSACWDSDGSKIYTGSADKMGKAWDLQSDQNVQFAVHDQPIKFVAEVPALNMIVTGSWDKSLKFWPKATLGNGTAAGTVQMGERIYAMDVKNEVAVVACADRNIHVFDLRNPSAPVKSHQSPLRHQVRTISLFSDNKGYAIGSIEGRVQIYHVDNADQAKNFAFKCHRDPNTQDIYAVNAICFHKQFGTFATAGSDGTFNFWDKDAKQRLKNFPKMQNAITAVDFNHTGDVFGYAVGCDWSKGYDQQSRTGEAVWLHPVTEAEVKPKRL